MRNYSFSLSQGYAGWVIIPFDTVPVGNISATLTKYGTTVANLTNTSFTKNGTNLQFTIGAGIVIPANDGMSYAISDTTGIIATGKIYVTPTPVSSGGNVDLSNYYNKTEVDAKIPDLSAYYTKTQVDSAVGVKANSSDVYTKAQMDTSLAGKASTASVSAKADATNVYTKSQSDSAVTAAKLATFTFFANGSLSVRTGTSKQRNPGKTIVLSKVYVDVGTAPVGASLIIDVKKNGTSLWTNAASRPTITDGNTAVNAVPTITSFVDGDYLTVDIVQIGSTTAGSDLTVMVVGA